MAPGPSNFKVVALEDGEKYIVRGSSWTSLEIRDVVDTDPLPGGVPDPAADWPAALWRQTSDLYAELAIR